MIDRYSRKELKEIWEDKNKYSIWLSIELAAAEAMEKYKIIPKGVVKKVKSKAKINVRRILDIEKDNKLFIAVGASHLAGKNGLLNLFKNAGYSLKPLTPFLD